MSHDALPLLDQASFRERARALGLYGVLASWAEFRTEPWLPTLLDLEETERRRRSLERRMRNARLGRFRMLADFDWSFPDTVDRPQIEELHDLGFLREAANVVLVGPNGVGKSTIAANLAHQAVLHGHTALFLTASELLNDLAAQESGSALQRRLKRYQRPQLLVIDEVGYLSYDTRHADLLFEVVTRRNLQKSTVITTNKPFAEWSQVFPNASSVTALIDRLVHRAEIVLIRGKSYRMKEAQEREQRCSAARKKHRSKNST